MKTPSLWRGNIFKKGGNRVLQYPINAYPENIAVDGVSGFKISYNFKGDKLSYTTYRIVNYDTGVVTSHYVQHSSMYNNDRVVSATINLTNGSDYVWQVALSQNQESPGSDPIYDIPVLSGAVASSQQSASTSIIIEKGITSIYEWWGNNDLQECSKDGSIVAYGMVMQIGNERRLIERYRRSTGEVLLESPFSSAIQSGATYRIYSNYIISPQYYFKCRTAPTIDMSSSHILTHSDNDFLGMGEYSQAENVMIKYYNLDLYWANNSFFYNYNQNKSKKIASTGNIYSQRLKYEFADYLYHDNLNSDGNDYYKVVCTVTTQDNAVVSDDYVITVPESAGEGSVTYGDTFGTTENTFVNIPAYLHMYHSGGNLVTYRKDLDTGEEVCLGDTRSSVKDYTASTHGNYLYTFIGFENTDTEYAGVGAFIPGAYLEKEVHTNDNGYYITELIEYDPTSGSSVESREHYDNRPHYHVGDTWHFMGEINDSTITQNRNTIFHVGAAKYGVSSNADTNYMSGALSAMIGYVDCATKEYKDDITLVQAWRKFITQNRPFMLKSQKGDVWIVEITDSPTTNYQEDYYKVPTTFSFSWAECCNIRDIVVKNLISDNL